MKKIQITIRLPKDIKEQLTVIARERGYTLKDLIIVILNQYFD